MIGTRANRGGDIMIQVLAGILLAPFVFIILVLVVAITVTIIASIVEKLGWMIPIIRQEKLNE